MVKLLIATILFSFQCIIYFTTKFVIIYNYTLEYQTLKRDKMTTYRTSQIAKITGIHSNTVRLYEDLGLVTPAKRLVNGYRVFNDKHVLEYKLARHALSMDKQHKHIRKKAIQSVKACAKNDFDTSLKYINELILYIRQEKINVEEIKKAKDAVITSKSGQENQLYFTRKKASEYINTTPDSIRNWEKKNLIQIKRKLNGYRIYTDEDLEKLRIIKVLKGLGYQLDKIKFRIDMLNNDFEDDYIYYNNQSKEYIKILK